MGPLEPVKRLRLVGSPFPRKWLYQGFLVKFRLIYSIESVAEYTSSPLLSITAADLGHEPEELEVNLLRFFNYASKWNAVVLLDEADVYLEARSVRDLRRNSIVSSKLNGN